MMAAIGAVVGVALPVAGGATDNNGGLVGVSRSLASTNIAYAAGGEIRTVSVTGSRSRVIGAGESPSWSPDGRELVFDSARNGFDENIWLTYEHAAKQRRIVTHDSETDDSTDDFDPAWSPVDDRIVFVSKRKGNDDIWTTNSIGHSTGNLTHDSPASDRAPAWSPNGESIAFVSNRRGNDDVFVMHLFVMGSGEDVTPVGATSAAEDYPAWSPDGRHIAFQTLRDGNWEIYVSQVDGAGLRRITDDPAADTRPAWSPDGKQLVFVSDRSGNRQLYIVDSGGGQAQRLRTEAAAADDPDWQPVVDVALAATRTVVARVGQSRRSVLQVANRMPLPALSLSLGVRVPGSIDVVQVRASGAVCRRFSRVINCSLRKLAMGKPAHVEITWRARRCGNVQFAASILGLRVDVDASNNSLTQRLTVVCRHR
jgi:dipeptidyl aminopeptidase/acylaminoacyl peptidase